MEPTVNLSGEVAGLKPPAVTDSPMDPRVFIVNRAGDATEVVSFQHTLFFLFCISASYPFINNIS